MVNALSEKLSLIEDLIAIVMKITSKKYFVKIILFLSSVLISNEISIGEISFKVVQKGISDRRYIWLHGDEQTAKMALENHMSSNQGIAYFINNNILVI